MQPRPCACARRRLNRHLPRFAALLLATGAALPAAVIVREPFAGVRWSHRTQVLPRPLNIHVLEIDLTHPGIRFLMSPSNGSAPGELTPQTVPAFVGAVQAQIGINASFFLTAAAGTNYDNRGVVASRGDVYSPFDGDNRPWPVLNLSADNFALILSQAAASSTTTAVTPAVPLYNAVSGSERILTNGRVTAGAVTFGEPTLLHPRTIAGISPDRRLVIATIDGRQTGVSEGFYGRESADLLLQYGCVDAVNLDGGGSTTLVFADPTPRVVNRISDPTPRAVGASLAIFAAPSENPGEVAIYADFYAGDAGGFAAAPAAAGGASHGLLATSTATTLASPEAVTRGWLQRLVLRDDPATHGGPEQPVGWFACHRWTGDTAGNAPRPVGGRIGFWARTSTPGIAASLAVKAPGLVRGMRQPMIADGDWHLYEWDLTLATAWEAWGGGEGRLTGATFTLDSLQFFGPNADAVIELDLVAHHSRGSLAPLVPAMTGRLANAALRATWNAANPLVTVGMSVTGAPATGSPFLLRAMGPSLGTLGVTGVLPDPRLDVYDAQRTLLAANAGWSGSPALAAAAGRLGAFPFVATTSRDAAALATLPSGNFLIDVSSSTSESGVAVVEVYGAAETAGGSATRLVNLSMRTRAGTAQETVVAGLVITGGTRRVLIRAVGPGLTQFGVGGTLADPQLAVYAGGALHALNDDWGGGPGLTEVFQRVRAFPLGATSRDAALLLTLEPGAYTAHVTSAAGATGTVLLEIYATP
jgi:hypothetical protein